MRTFNIENFLREVKRLGVTVRLSQCRSQLLASPAPKLTDDIVAVLEAHRDNIVRHLGGTPAEQLVRHWQEIVSWAITEMAKQGDTSKAVRTLLDDPRRDVNHERHAQWLGEIAAMRGVQFND